MGWRDVEGGRRAAPSSAAGQLRCAVFNNTPSLSLPCDSVKHQGIMHLALTILCKFCLPYTFPWAASSSEVWQLSMT